MTDQHKRIEEHTPGPWIISETFGAIDGEEDISLEHEGVPICTVRGTNDMSCIDEEDVEQINREVIATARLIASAPDLLQKVSSQAKEIEELKAKNERWLAISKAYQHDQNKLVEEKADLITELTRLRSLHEELKVKTLDAYDVIRKLQDQRDELTALNEAAEKVIGMLNEYITAHPLSTVYLRDHLKEPIDAYENLKK